MGRKSGDIHLLIHGHFYQPPRENPWLHAIEEQESASPHHDWNERILAECYRPVTRSRVLDPLGRVRAIVNNLENISFNFGPTLLSWLENADRDTYARVLEADKRSAEVRSGHGNAIAQAYHHVILPLVPREDRITLIRWGLADFERRFGRKSEGLWLPETAIHGETAIDVARAGVRFLILSPYQAWKTRPLAGGEWRDVSDGSIDPRRAYRLFPDPKDPSLFLDVFFYDRGLSVGISFEHYLHNADALAKRLAEAAGEPTGAPRLVAVATDGEVYGHHEPFGDMCLAALFDSAAERLGLRATNPGEFLERRAPEDEVVLKPGPGGEGTAWSCHHGVGRWSRDCGCSIAHKKGWNQAWRAPLREALLALRADLTALFEEEGAGLLREPRRALDSYVDVLSDGTEESWRLFVEREARGSETWNAETHERAHSLLEMAHECLRMFTSCGWFFDDLAGIESVQDLLFACHALDLARAIDAERAAKAERNFRRELRAARSNVPEEGDGQSIFDDRVLSARVEPDGWIASCAAARLVGASVPPRLLGSRDVSFAEERRVRTGRMDILTGRLRVRLPLAHREEQFRFVAAREDDLSALVWVGGDGLRIEEAGRAATSAELEGLLGMPPRDLSDFPREMRMAIAERVLEEMREDLVGGLEGAYGRHAAAVDLLAGCGVRPPGWLRELLPLILERRVRLAVAELLSAAPGSDGGAGALRALADASASAARLRLGADRLLDERPVRAAFLAVLRDGRGEDLEPVAGRVLALLRGLADAGFPLLELGSLQDEFFAQVGRAAAIGPKTRALGEWLRFAPEVFGTKRAPSEV